jgi:hypothetical protein
MTWLLWRQHRGQALVTAVGLTVFAIIIWITGVSMAHTLQHARATPEIGRLFQGDGFIIDTVHITIALPLVLGAFLGAPLIARETEVSTNVLVWTQTVTRRQWVFRKVALAVIASIAVAVAISALVTWWSGTPNSLYGNRFEGAEFDTQNLMPVACAIFAVALAIAAGAYFRRTLPALGTTIFGYVAVRLVMAIYLRPHLGTPTKALIGVGPNQGAPSGSWTLSQDLVDAHGHVMSGPIPVPAGCTSALARSGDPGACLDKAGYHMVLKYFGPGQYWHFQLVESGVLVLLAAGLLAYAIQRTLRHDA